MKTSKIEEKKGLFFGLFWPKLKKTVVFLDLVSAEQQLFIRIELWMRLLARSKPRC